jgi:MFS transporter, DHA2 family, multidrug resistance protein
MLNAMPARANIPKATRRDWIGLAVLALPCLLYSMDLTILNLAVPHISADLKPSSPQLLWIVDIYGFLLAGFLIPMGTLGDRIGRQRLLMFGAAAFGGGSLLAAFSTTAEMLIATRALLGVAAATLAPSTLSLLRNMFLDSGERMFAISVWVTSFSAGAAIGPLVGGALLQYFWWGSAFLVAVPVMVLLLAIGPALLPEFRSPEAGRLDLVSASLSLGAVLPVIYGLKVMAADGVGWQSLVAIIGGLVVGVGFVRRQQSLSDPLIDLQLFKVPAFSAALVTNTLDFFVGFGSYLFIAQYLQLVLGLSPLHAGILSVPSSVGFIAGSLLTPTIVRRVPPGFVMAAGLALAAVGFGLLMQLEAASGAGIVVLGSFVFSLGLAPVTTLATDIMVGAAPPERAGAAAAISETSSEFGGALGIAILGSIGTAVYRRTMTAAAPDGVPASALEAASDTLGAAAESAAQLTPEAGAALFDVARAAFVQSFHLAAGVSAVIALAAAVIAALTLRHAGTGGETAETAGEVVEAE